MAAIGSVDSQRKCSTCKNRGQKALRKRRRWAGDYLFLCHRLWCGAFVLSTRVGKMWHLTWSAWASHTPSCPPGRHPCCCPSAGLWRSVPGEVAPLKILSDSAGLSWVDRDGTMSCDNSKSSSRYGYTASIWGNQITSRLFPGLQLLLSSDPSWTMAYRELWSTWEPRWLLEFLAKKKKGEPIAALLENSISASLFLFLFRTPQSLPSHPLQYLYSQN